MKLYQVTLQISESGHVARLSAPNGRIIAEILVDGPLGVCAHNAVHNIPIEKGRANVFRGELIALDKDEILDVEAEQIYKKA